MTDQQAATFGAASWTWLVKGLEGLAARLDALVAIGAAPDAAALALLEATAGRLAEIARTERARAAVRQLG